MSFYLLRSGGGGRVEKRSPAKGGRGGGGRGGKRGGRGGGGRGGKKNLLLIKSFELITTHSAV